MNCFASKPNYQTTKCFFENVLSKEIKKVMNMLVPLTFPILDVSKISMYQFLFDYIKLKYNDKVQFYIDIGRSIV